MNKIMLIVCAMWVLGACTNVEDSALVVNQAISALDGGDGDAGEVDTDTVEEPELFWYFRCNSTSFALNDASRLVETDDPNILSIVYDVVYPWMITTGESCNLLRTEAEDEWHPGLVVYNSVDKPFMAPGSGTMTVQWGQFGVKYAALGTYEFRFNLEDNTFTITPVGEGGPTCNDGEQNGDETDIDCGGPECAGCADGLQCVVNGDCLSNLCEDGICEAQVNDCNADIAIDLGNTGHDVTVPTNGCVKVEAGYPSWWGTSRTMNLMNPAGAGYPIPFTWENTCAEGAGAGSFEQDWQSKYLSPTSAECATVINLLGNGATDITLHYFGL